MRLNSLERRKKEKENRKNAILKIARKLFFDKGFKSVTIDNIAAKTGLSKGSIYLCFESKEEIYVQVLISDNIETNKKNKYYLESEAPASQLLLEFAQNYIDSFLGNNELFRILMTFMLNSDQMNLTEDQNRELIRTTNDNIKVVSQLLQKGIDQGEFYAAIDLRKTQNAIWGLLNGVIALYIFTGDPERRAERIHTTVKNSLEIIIKGLKA